MKTKTFILKKAIYDGKAYNSKMLEKLILLVYLYETIMKEKQGSSYLNSKVGVGIEGEMIHPRKLLFKSCTG